MAIVRLVLGALISVLEFTIIIECIGSFILPGENRLFKFVAKINSPFLTPIRNILYKCYGPNMALDFSPFVLFLLISLLRNIFMI